MLKFAPHHQQMVPVEGHNVQKHWRHLCLSVHFCLFVSLSLFLVATACLSWLFSPISYPFSSILLTLSPLSFILGDKDSIDIRRMTRETEDMKTEPDIVGGGYHTSHMLHRPSSFLVFSELCLFSLLSCVPKTWSSISSPS